LDSLAGDTRIVERQKQSAPLNIPCECIAVARGIALPPLRDNPAFRQAISSRIGHSFHLGAGGMQWSWPRRFDPWRIKGRNMPMA